MTLYVDGEWQGWAGDTVVKLTDGTVWIQDEFWYSYRYSYRPKVIISGTTMHVDGMTKAIRVRRVQ